MSDYQNLRLPIISSSNLVHKPPFGAFENGSVKINIPRRTKFVGEEEGRDVKVVRFAVEKRACDTNYRCNRYTCNILTIVFFLITRDGYLSNLNYGSLPFSASLIYMNRVPK